MWVAARHSKGEQEGAAPADRQSQGGGSGIGSWWLLGARVGVWVVNAALVELCRQLLPADPLVQPLIRLQRDLKVHDLVVAIGEADGHVLGQVQLRYVWNGGEEGGFHQQ